MSTELQTTAAQTVAISAETMELVIGKGDLSQLTPAQRVEYLTGVCRSMGLNPLTRPIQLMSLNGKTVPYATRDCTDQLRKLSGISIQIVSREVSDGLAMVTVRATDPSGRTDESMAAVPCENLKGEAKANALMKAETKGKRRVTLCICGLGLLDEAEVASVQEAMQKPLPQAAAPPDWKTRKEMLDAFAGQRERIGALAYERVMESEGIEDLASEKRRDVLIRTFGMLALIQDMPVAEVVE